MILFKKIKENIAKAISFLFVTGVILSSSVSANATASYIPDSVIQDIFSMDIEKKATITTNLEISNTYKDWSDKETADIDCENITIIATTKADITNIRTEKDVNANVLHAIGKGATLTVVSMEKDEWVCVNVNGEDGYVTSNSVELSFLVDNTDLNEYYKEHKAYKATEEEKLLLAAVVHCEARGESYEGQLAVASVVMNRIRSEKFPDTIEEVLRAKNQFSTVMNGSVDRVYKSGNINESCIKAAEEALSGVSNVGDYTHFRRNDGREGLVIGNHVFHVYTRPTKTQ